MADPLTPKDPLRTPDPFAQRDPFRTPDPFGIEPKKEAEKPQLITDAAIKAALNPSAAEFEQASRILAQGAPGNEHVTMVAQRREEALQRFQRQRQQEREQGQQGAEI